MGDGRSTMATYDDEVPMANKPARPSKEVMYR